MSIFSSASNITTEINSRSVSNASFIFGIDGNSQRPISSNETRLTIDIYDIIILEGLFFNLSQKPGFKKLMEFASNISKNYIHTNRNLIFKHQMDLFMNRT